MRALSPQGRVDLETPPRLGEVWHSAARGLNIKRHPVVGAAQRAADMAIGLHEAGAPRAAAQIARIAVTVSERHAAVIPFGLPESGLQAKFSLPFIVACGLLHGRVGLAEVSDAGAADPALRALAALVEVGTTDASDPDWRDAAPSDALVVEARDGSRFEAPPLARWRGHADNPLTPEGVWRKFEDCTRHGAMPAPAARALFEALQRVESLPGAAAIAA
jgi:2-methylcitrate dehydratase PrpD